MFFSKTPMDLKYPRLAAPFCLFFIWQVLFCAAHKIPTLLQNGIVPFDIGKRIGKRQKQPRLFVIFLFVRGHHQIDMLQLYRVRVYIEFPFPDRRFQTKPNAVKDMRIPRRSAQRNQILHGFAFARAAVNRNGHGHIVFCRGLTMATGCIACKNGVLKGRIRSTAIFSDGTTANRYIKKKAYCAMLL